MGCGLQHHGAASCEAQNNRTIVLWKWIEYYLNKWKCSHDEKQKTQSKRKRKREKIEIIITDKLKEMIGDKKRNKDTCKCRS